MTYTPTTDDEAELLVRVLARQDALNRPHRNPSCFSWNHIHEARRHYAERGLPWLSSSANNTEAQRASRALLKLNRSGVIRRLKTKGEGARTVGLILTIEGDQVAGLLMADDREYTARVFIKEVHRISMERSGSPFAIIPEISLNADKDGYEAGWGDGRQRELITVEDLFLPAAARGWAETYSTTRGNAGYSLTRAGLEALSEPERDEIEFEDRDPVIRDVYLAEFRTAWDEWQSRTDYNPEMGKLPIPPALFAFAKKPEGVAHA